MIFCTFKITKPYREKKEILMVKRNFKTLKQKTSHKLNPCKEFIFPTTNNNIKNQILKCLKAYTQLLQIPKRWVISRCSFQNRMDKI